LTLTAWSNSLLIWSLVVFFIIINSGCPINVKCLIFVVGFIRVKCSTFSQWLCGQIVCSWCGRLGFKLRSG